MGDWLHTIPLEDQLVIIGLIFAVIFFFVGLYTVCKKKEKGDSTRPLRDCNDACCGYILMCLCVIIVIVILIAHSRYTTPEITVIEQLPVN